MEQNKLTAVVNVSYQMSRQDLYDAVKFLRNGDETHVNQIIDDLFTKPVLIDFNKMSFQEKTFIMQGFIANIISASAYNEEWEVRKRDREALEKKFGPSGIIDN